VTRCTRVDARPTVLATSQDDVYRLPQQTRVAQAVYDAASVSRPHQAKGVVTGLLGILPKKVPPKARGRYLHSLAIGRFRYIASRAER